MFRESHTGRRTDSFHTIRPTTHSASSAFGKIRSCAAGTVVLVFVLTTGGSLGAVSRLGKNQRRQPRRRNDTLC